MADPIVSKTPLETLDANQAQANATGVQTSANTTPVNPAPTVVTGKDATTQALKIQQEMNDRNTGASANSIAKNNTTTTYDPQGNMVITGGTLANGQTYTQNIPKGGAGYIPNPVDVEKQQKLQQENQQNQQTSALTAAATGNQSTTNQIYNNPSSVTPPPGIDPTIPSGQVDWYNQDQKSFTDWANEQDPSGKLANNIERQATQQKTDLMASDITNKLNQIMAGTYPLTPDQQSQVDATKQQFDSLINQQRQTNESYENGVRILGNVTGRSQYFPDIAMGEVQTAVNSGLAKIADLTSKESLALAQMKQGFTDSNFKMVQSAYDILNGIQTSKMNELNKINDDIVTAQKDTRDAQLRQDEFNWKQVVDNKDMDLKDKNLALDKLKLDEQTKKDALDAIHQQNQDAIASGELKIKQLEYNATYGFMQNTATGQSDKNFTPTDIPGVKQSVKGVYYFDPTQFTDKKQATAAENVARQAGISILSDKTDVEAMTNLNGAITNLATLESMFKDLAPGNAPGAKLGEKIGNTFSALGSVTGIYTTDTRSKLDAYNTNRDQLFKQIYALAGGHPKINSQELEAAANAMPRLNILNMDTLKGGEEKLMLTRKYLYNAIRAEVPNANLPQSGDLIYNSTDELLKAHPDRAQQAADLAKQGHSDEDIRTILNY